MELIEEVVACLEELTLVPGEQARKRINLFMSAHYLTLSTRVQF